MSLQRSIDFAVYCCVRAALAVVQALPLATCEELASMLANLCCYVIPVRRQVIDDNLQTAFPEKSARERRQIAHAMWKHLFLMGAEIAHTPRKIHRTNWKDHSQIEDVEAFVRTLISDHPKVIISGHFGNFELGGYLMGLFGFPTYTIARPLDNPYLHRWVNDFRGRTGQYILPKDGCGDQIIELMKQGAILTLLGDQAAGPKGCWVNFFGKPASTHKAVAVFSLGNDAPTMVSYARRLEKPLHYEVGPFAVVDPNKSDFSLRTIPQLAQWYTDCLEQIVRKSPEQYWWLHRRWKGEPPQKKRERPQRLVAPAA